MIYWWIIKKRNKLVCRQNESGQPRIPLMFHKFCLSNENSSWLFSTLFFIETSLRRLSNINITLFEKEKFLFFIIQIFSFRTYTSLRKIFMKLSTHWSEILYQSRSRMESMRMAELISLTNKEIKISQINNNWLVRGKNTENPIETDMRVDKRGCSCDNAIALFVRFWRFQNCCFQNSFTNVFRHSRNIARHCLRDLAQNPKANRAWNVTPSRVITGYA